MASAKIKYVTQTAATTFAFSFVCFFFYVLGQNNVHGTNGGRLLVDKKVTPWCLIKCRQNVNSEQFFPQEHVMETLFLCSSDFTVFLTTASTWMVAHVQVQLGPKLLNFSDLAGLVFPTWYSSMAFQSWITEVRQLVPWLALGWVTIQVLKWIL